MSAPLLASPFEALSLCLRIGSIGVGITSLESLFRRADLGPSGLLNGAAQLTRARWLLPFAGLNAPGIAVALTAIRLAAACAVIGFGGNFEVARAGAITIAVATLLLKFRTTLGIHPSSAMMMVTFTAAALGLGAGTRRSMGFALGFIAAQACLAYFAAGAGKLSERPWRAGRKIVLIVSSVGWGNRREAEALQAHPRLALALSWMTMLGECSIPLALVLPLPLAIALLGCAAFFHLTTAVEMGLNNFVWAFGSTYPAIIYAWYVLHG